MKPHEFTIHHRTSGKSVRVTIDPETLDVWVEGSGHVCVKTPVPHTERNGKPLDCVVAVDRRMECPKVVVCPHNAEGQPIGPRPTISLIHSSLEHGFLAFYSDNDMGMKGKVDIALPLLATT